MDRNWTDCRVPTHDVYDEDNQSDRPRGSAKDSPVTSGRLRQSSIVGHHSSWCVCRANIWPLQRGDCCQSTWLLPYTSSLPARCRFTATDHGTDLPDGGCDLLCRNSPTATACVTPRPPTDALTMPMTARRDERRDSGPLSGPRSCLTIPTDAQWISARSSARREADRIRERTSSCRWSRPKTTSLP
jgi:hypothetical protein